MRFSLTRLVQWSQFVVVLMGTAASLAVPPENQRDGDQVFVPSGGFLRTNRVLELRRRAADADLAPPPTVSRLQGRRQIPVILLEYQKGGHPHPAASFQTLLFDSAAELHGPSGLAGQP